MKGKRFLRLLLAMALSFALLLTVNAEHSASLMGAQLPAWPQVGAVKTTKTAAPVAGETNQWKITLAVEAQNRANKADIVLVIDTSSNMGGTKLNQAKAAASQFVVALLENPNTKNENTRIAIVSYADSAIIRQGLTQDPAALHSAINGLSANGGSFAQAGIREASVLLNDTSPTTRRDIILLSDGQPTYSYALTNPYSYSDLLGDHAETNASAPSSAYDYEQRVGTGNSPRTQYTVRFKAAPATDGGYFTSPHKLYLDSNCQEDAPFVVAIDTLKYYDASRDHYYAVNQKLAGDGQKYILIPFPCQYNHGNSTIAEAGFVRNQGRFISAIAIGAGADGAGLLQAIASYNRYHTSLDPILQEMAGFDKSAAKDADVSDPIGAGFFIPGITASNLHEKVTVSQGTLTYNADTKTLQWDIGTLTSPNPDYAPYTSAKIATMEYIVSFEDIDGILTLDPGKEDYPTNGVTTLKFTDINDQKQTLNIDVPEVMPEYGSLTYDGNGSDSGIAPVDNNGYLKDAVVTVKDCGTLKKDNHTFSGWNTAAGGNGTPYAPEATFTMPNHDVTLYAQWTENPHHNVIYNGNGNTGGTVPITEKQYVGAGVTVKDCGTLQKDDHTFNGWNTAADGNGTPYAPGDTFSMPDEAVTLYAQWTENPRHNVIYDGNGNTGGTPPITEEQYINTIVTVKGPGTLARDNYTFSGWNTAADGNGTPYAPEATFSMPDEAVTLYAQWTENPHHNVIYNGNGNTSGTTPITEKQYVGASVTVKDPGTMKRIGYDFGSWLSSSDNKPYAAEATFTMPEEDVTLTAQWKAKTDAYYRVNYQEIELLKNLMPSKLVFNQEYDSLVTEEADFIAGYTALPLTEQTQAIKYNTIFEFLYKKDLTQTKDISYTVEYYKDGAQDADETQTVTKSVWVNDTSASADAINTATDKYTGYKFDSTDPATLPTSFNDGDVFKVYYVKDESQTKDISYTVEYYKDGVQDADETQTVTKPIWVNDTSASIDTIDTADNKFTGYSFVNIDPVSWPAEFTDGDVFKVYYMKNAIPVDPEEPKHDGYHRVDFLSAAQGALEPRANADGKSSFDILNGRTFAEVRELMPDVVPNSGWDFSGWEPQLLSDTARVENDLAFTAQYVLSHTGGGGGGGGGISTKTCTVTFASNGGITIAKVTVNQDGKLTKPDDPTKDGFIFAGWFTDKELTREYDFTTLVTDDFTLYAKWIEADAFTPEWINPFTDVKPSDWFYGAVAFAVQNQLLAGTSAATFDPNGIMTRAMLVTVLHRLAGEPQPGKNVFNDVPAGMWYTEAVAWAAEEGIVSGYGGELFGPDDILTREQIALILYRYALATGADVSIGENTNILSYTDFEEISEYAIPAMQWAAGAGLITGRPGGILDPKGGATRAEIASILQRFIGNIE